MIENAITDVISVIRRLSELASAPFEPTAFRAACESFAHFDTSSSHDDLWSFQIAPILALTVAVEVEPTNERKSLGQMVYRPIGVKFAVLSFCWWLTFLRSQHPTNESYQ